VIKEKSHGCKSTKPHLCFVVATANLCLTCTPYITGVKYRALLQANQPTFFSCSFYQTVLPVGIKTHKFAGQNKGPGGVSKHTVNLTTYVENARKTRAKKQRFGQPLFDLSRARLCKKQKYNHNKVKLK
jgi:hypothetical protein